MGRINATFGDQTIFSAAMAGMEQLVIDRISFGAIANWRKCTPE